MWGVLLRFLLARLRSFQGAAYPYLVSDRCRTGPFSGVGRRLALEADGARRLGNEFFFSAPQLKRDPLGGREWQSRQSGTPGCLSKQRTSSSQPAVGPVRGCRGFSVAFLLPSSGGNRRGNAAGQVTMVAPPNKRLKLSARVD